jgi:putative spermidine/putrescine transport system ATP-binding protein
MLFGGILSVVYYPLPVSRHGLTAQDFSMRASSSHSTSNETRIRGHGTPAIRVREIRKTFGSGAGTVHAVDGVDLDIAHGEFFCLLGPSGSGKTTLLRMIAGFELPSAGSIHLDGVDVTAVAPFDRDVNTVFQDYALFPHMTVLQNIEYGLKVKKVGKSERRERAEQALKAVRLGGYGSRKPSQLSGGQRQRIALARALVNRPKVLLLDEPLGALDLKLRQQMQIELKAIQKQAGITFIFVTHDQEEALTMSDRIAVFNNGRIEQVGTPREIYENPTSPFVAGFVGISNLVSGAAAKHLMGSDATFSVRPERLALHPVNDGEIGVPVGRVWIEATVNHIEYLGSLTRVGVALGDGEQLIVQLANASNTPLPYPVGAAVRVSFDPEAARPMITE